MGKTKNFIRKAVRKIRRSCELTVNFFATQKVEGQYRAAGMHPNAVNIRGEGVELAVVIHLFYIDNWPLFKRKLGNLLHEQFDLFITMPQQNEDFIENITRDFPRANVLIVPNHGRDVLPFVKVARLIKEMGYTSLLKFHSKKSTHRTDGQDWLEGMLDSLLPEDKELITSVRGVLRNSETGIIGPSGVYYPLTVNFPANGAHMTNIVSKLYGRHKAYEVLQERRQEYGFFGGTMFWARLDAVEKLLNWPVWYFEREQGQIDGTFAHALERLFCIVPEIEGKKMYELSGQQLINRDYNSDNIPNWSEDHLK